MKEIFTSTLLSSMLQNVFPATKTQRHKVNSKAYFSKTTLCLRAFVAFGNSIAAAYSLVLVCALISFPTHAQSQETAEFSSLKILNTGSDGEMLGFSVSRDQKYFAIANENKVIKLFDGKTGKFIRRFQGYHTNVIEIVLLPGGDRLLSAGLENSLATIDLRTGEFIKTLQLPNHLRSLDVNGDGTEAVVGDSKGVITFIDLKTLQISKQLVSGTPQVSSVRYSPDFSKVAAGTGVAVGYMIKKFPILILDAKSKQVIQNLEGQTGATTALKFSSDGKRLFSGHKSNKHALVIWDLQTGKGQEIKSTFNAISLSGYNGIEINKDNTVLVATTDDESVEVYDLLTGEQLSKKSRGKVRLIRKLDHFPQNIFSLSDGKDFIIRGFNKNLLYIFNTEKKGITGYFHSFNDEWAVVAADGRMDGSEHAIQNLVWKEGFYEIPLDNTFEKNFTPQLLGQLLAEQKSEKEFDVKQAAAVLPEMHVAQLDGKPFTTNTKFSTTKKMIKVVVNIDKNPGDVAELRLHQNSKLVSTAAGSAATSYTFDISLTDAFGADNYFFVTARSKAGIESEKKTFVINYQGKTSEQSKLYLFTVGINQYKNPKYNLNYALADANELNSIFKTGASSLFGEVVQISLRDSKASREEILKGFATIKNQIKEQDLLIFYYAGHGVMSEGKEKQPDFYLIPYDVTQLYGRDDLLESKAISAAELRDLAKNINAQKQVYILDACQSSGALEAIATRGAAEEKALAQLARSTGTFWITATGTEQFATEFKELGHGVFTYSLIEGLSGKADNGDKRITVKELSSYIENRVPELSEKYKGTAQYPSGYSYGNDFPLVIVK